MRCHTGKFAFSPTPLSTDSSNCLTKMYPLGVLHAVSPYYDYKQGGEADWVAKNISSFGRSSGSGSRHVQKQQQQQHWASALRCLYMACFSEAVERVVAVKMSNYHRLFSAPDNQQNVNCRREVSRAVPIPVSVASPFLGTGVRAIPLLGTVCGSVTLECVLRSHHAQSECGCVYSANALSLFVFPFIPLSAGVKVAAEAVVEWDRRYCQTSRFERGNVKANETAEYSTKSSEPVTVDLEINFTTICHDGIFLDEISNAIDRIVRGSQDETKA